MRPSKSCRTASLVSLAARPSVGRTVRRTSRWPNGSPLADISEDDKEYLIKLELPEVKKEDVNVTVENRVLTISGERKFEKEEKNEVSPRRTCIRQLYAAFTLPDDADAEKGKAEFKDGMLTVHVSKSEKAKPKQIEVAVA